MRRKCLSMLMMIAIILSMIPMSIPVMAKENLPSVSGSRPIYTYTYKSSGKIYRYTDSSLKTKEKGHWIDCAKDECKIIGIKNDAVKVVYPTSKGPQTGWFMRSEFCKRNLKADQAKYSFRATKKITTYRWKENNTVYGYISKGDRTYLLRGDQNSSWLQVLYPVSGGYKMAWVKGDDLYANNIKLNKSSINKQGVGWSETLTATLSPSNSDDYVSWSSSNPSVATVSGSGVVTGVGYGTTVITATTKRGKTAKVSVNVGQPAAKHFVDINCVLDGKEYWDLAGCATVDIYINGKADETNVNDYYKEWPEGTRFEVRNIKTKSGFKYDGVRNSGLSGTVRNGKVDIRLVFKKNKSQTVPVTGIKLNKTSASIAVGKTLTLSATVSPSNATNKSVKWSSSNAKVATVSGGKVKGVTAGTATVTAKSNNGKTSTCKVTVIENEKCIVTDAEINRAAQSYGIKEGSKAYKALKRINSKYASNSDVYKNRSDLLVFMFEGVGNSSTTSQHRNAMCVVVRKGKIKLINRNCTTIPDKPFSSYSHPTLVSGVYRIKAWNHHPDGAKSDYAAFKIYSLSWGAPKLMRFNNSKKKTFDFNKNMTSINIHGRWSYNLTGESLGCQLVGAPSFGSKKKSSEYLAFCKATGIIKNSIKTMTYKTHYTDYQTGFYILDRSFGQQYLNKIGYPNNAMTYMK